MHWAWNALVNNTEPLAEHRNPIGDNNVCEHECVYKHTLAVIAGRDPVWQSIHTDTQTIQPFNIVPPLFKTCLHHTVTLTSANLSSFMLSYTYLTYPYRRLVLVLRHKMKLRWFCEENRCCQRRHAPAQTGPRERSRRPVREPDYAWRISSKTDANLPLEETAP